MPERIARPAILSSCVIITGKNHAECLARLPEDRKRGKEVQGFMTTKCRFVGRQEAYNIAKENDQLRHDHPLKELFLEDLICIA